MSKTFFLPTRDLIIFPGIVTPLYVGRLKSINTLEAAVSTKGKLVLGMQIDASKEEPNLEKDIHKIGVVANILQIVKMPNNNIKVLVEAEDRVEIESAEVEDEMYKAEYKVLKCTNGSTKEAEAIYRKVLGVFEKYVGLTGRVSSELLVNLKGIKNVNNALDVVSANLPLKSDKKQELLEVLDVTERGLKILELLTTEMEIASLEKKIDDTKWNFCLYQPKEELEKSVWTLLLGNIPVLLLCLLLILLLGYFFSRKMVERLEQLTENMNQINLGLRKVTVVSQSKDEIGVLVRTFTRMMDEINKLISQVYEAKIKLQKTEMKALQAQINPHFLYNSLSIINWKALEADNEEISRITLALSTYYRTSLNKGETMTIAANEIRNIDAYLQIQLIMHDNSFQVIKEIQEDALSYSVPKLILQPLVENAIEHGLDVSEKEEKWLKISVCKEKDALIMAVEDNGMGMSEEQAKSIITYRSKGYGVRNVNDRITLLYGEEYHLRVKSRQGEGCRIEIVIPVNKEEKRYE